MHTIYKYPLESGDVNEIEMPEGAKVLTVQIQRDIPCIWALVDPNMDNKVVRRFHIYGTGYQILRPNDRYIGTFQLYGGALVFHVFEEQE